jgi:hypothetical protein
MPGNTDQDQQELLHLNRDTPQPADRDTREINRAHTRRSNRDTPLFRLVNKPPGQLRNPSSRYGSAGKAEQLSLSFNP